MTLSLLLSLLFLTLPLTASSSFSHSFRALSSSPSSPSLSRPIRHLALPLSTPSLSPFRAETTSPRPSSNHSFHLTSTGYTEASVTLSGCSNVDFSASVYIEGQGPYNLIVDTGSTTMAVISDICACNGVTPIFDRNGLPTTIDEGKVGVHYADGSSWTGAGYTGVVSVGDPAKGGSVGVSMVFASIDTQSSFVNYTACGVGQAKRDWHQGIMGFAYPSIASSGTDEWFAKYVAATGIANEFTLQLCVTPSGQSSGNLWLGAMDLAFVGGQFTYVSIVKQQHYNVYLNRITVNSQATSTSKALPYDSSTLGPCNDDTGSTDCAIIDSGTTFLSLPTVALEALIAALQADSAYQQYVASRNDILGSGTCYPVASFSQNKSTLNALLPTLSFTFGDTSTGVNPSTVTLSAIEGYLVTSYDGSTPPNAYYCSGLGSTGGANAAILGYSFMSQFTVRHDIANSRIGFAPTAQCGEAATILPDYRWEASEWGQCSASCGGGVQWREVNCTDIFGAGYTTIVCANGFAGPEPPLSQSCNPQPCALDASTAVTAITSSTYNVTQGNTIVLSYTYTGHPDSIALYLAPANGSTVATWPVYITRNASNAHSSASATSTTSTTSAYSWRIPPTVPPGTYHLAGFTQSPSASYVSPVRFVVHGCTSSDPVQCGGDPCDSLSWCNGHGACDSSTSPPQCTCVAGYNGSDCSAPPADRGCSIQCLNDGYADASTCTCVCPSNFDGVLCEQRYATITGVFGVQASAIGTLALGWDAALWAEGLATDVSFALGLPASQVGVMQIIPAGSAGTKAAVSFWVSVPTSTADLSAYLSAFTALALPASTSSYTALSQGLITRYLTSFSVINMPPVGSGSPDDTGQSITEYVVGNISLVTGVGCGVMAGLMLLCLVCIWVQRREARKTLSHTAHRRKKSVLLREKLHLEAGGIQ